MAALSKILSRICILIPFFVACVSGVERTPDAAVPDAVSQPELSQELVILHTNDHHGHPLAFDEYPVKEVGGLPARMTLVQQQRKLHPHLLVLDGGDLSTGRPESNFFKAEPDIIGYNAIGYDALAIGNHEFDLPAREYLFPLMKKAKFPFLSANLKFANGSDVPGVKPYIIKTVGKWKVAILGLLTTETKSAGNPVVIAEFRIEDEVKTAQRWVPELRKQADVVIVLGHLGLFADEKHGSRRVANGVSGIDLIVDGHTHSALTEPVFQTDPSGARVPIVQTQGYGITMGKVVFREENGGPVFSRFEVLHVNNKVVEKKADGSKETVFVGEPLVQDPALLALLQPFSDKVDAALSQVVAQASEPLSDKEIRAKEVPLAHLVTDSMLWCSRFHKPDFVVQNGGGIRAPMPAGDVTKRKIFEIVPFDNTIQVLTLPGDAVQELFDFMATVGPAQGSWPHVAGASAVLNAANKKGTQVRIGGKPFSHKRSYRVVTNSFMGAGGDGYSVFLRRTNMADTARYQRECLIDYLVFKGGKVPVERGVRLIRK